ncbi:MAG: hypothetical protein IPH75_10735 [bacterium]|nr:hypothetical protein [bacterium]
MISTDKQIMMKVVQDQQTKEAWLYLLADDAELCRHALIYPFKMDRGYVSDAHGRVNLGKIDWPADDLLTAELRLPSASFYLAPIAEIEQGTPQVIESSNGDILKVVYHAEGEFRRLEIQIIELKGITPDSPVRMAVCERSSTHLQVLHSTKAPSVNITGVKDPGAIELYLYQ